MSLGSGRNTIRNLNPFAWKCFRVFSKLRVLLEQTDVPETLLETLLALPLHPHSVSPAQTDLPELSGSAPSEDRGRENGDRRSRLRGCCSACYRSTLEENFQKLNLAVCSAPDSPIGVPGHIDSLKGTGSQG